MFSLTEISFSVGLVLGPLVCGSLTDAFGFQWTACAMGESRGVFFDGSRGKIADVVNVLSSWRCRLGGMYVLYLLHPQVCGAGS